MHRGERIAIPQGTYVHGKPHSTTTEGVRGTHTHTHTTPQPQGGREDAQPDHDHGPRGRGWPAAPDHIWDPGPGGTRAWRWTRAWWWTLFRNKFNFPGKSHPPHTRYNGYINNGDAYLNIPSDTTNIWYAYLKHSIRSKKQVHFHI